MNGFGLDRDEIHRVHQRIAELAKTLHTGDSYDDAALLAAITEHAAEVIPGAQHAGITIIDKHGRIRTAACTNQCAVVLDDLQREHGEGPCLISACTQRTVRVDDLEHDEQFAGFGEAAIAQTPIRSILSLDLFAADHTMSALNVYAERPSAFTNESVQIGRIYATHSALAWDASRRSGQFERALASRDLVGQAKGIVMERFGVDAVQAFELLRRLSQNNNVAVSEIAERLIRAQREGIPRT